MVSPNHHWLRKWLRFEPHFIIGSEDDPYLLRWFVLPRNHFVNVYLHKFMRSDDDRALHDHPWSFLSWIIKGEYIEHAVNTTTLRKRWSIAYRPAKYAHRVQLLRGAAIARERTRVRPMRLEQPVWTLIVTGPKMRSWGFHCPSGWQHWKRFDMRNGCGEQ